jgi:hypothetical protein
MEVAESDEKLVFVYNALMNKVKTKIILYLQNSVDRIFIVPESVEIIDSYAFNNCNNLETVIIHEGNTYKRYY